MVTSTQVTQIMHISCIMYGHLGIRSSHMHRHSNIIVHFTFVLSGNVTTHPMCCFLIKYTIYDHLGIQSSHIDTAILLSTLHVRSIRQCDHSPNVLWNLVTHISFEQHCAINGIVHSQCTPTTMYGAPTFSHHWGQGAYGGGVLSWSIWLVFWALGVVD